MNMTALKPMQNHQPQPAWPDSAAFWQDKGLIVTGGSGFLGSVIGNRDQLKTIARPAWLGAA